MYPYEQKIQTFATKQLIGRKIVTVRFMTEDEARDQGFTSRPIMLIFDDGNWVAPQSDDEGNDGGALATTFDGFETIGVI